MFHLKYMRAVIEGEMVEGITEGIETLREIKGDIFGDHEYSGKEYSISGIEKYLTPVVPSKIVAVGLNYRAHAEETGMKIPDEPLLFLKPPSSAIAHGEAVVYPPSMTRRVDYEAELGIVLGKTCRNILPENADDYILGYTCFNDITARDLQSSDGQWTRSKSFDTFAPFGPWVSMNVDPSNLDIRLVQNEKVVQHSSTSDFIFKVPFIVSYISRIMTLNPGDVIATGTPSGIGPVAVGDVLKVQIENIGELVNTVIEG